MMILIYLQQLLRDIMRYRRMTNLMKRMEKKRLFKRRCLFLKLLML
jgi:hypothetical protein